MERDVALADRGGRADRSGLGRMAHVRRDGPLERSGDDDLRVVVGVGDRILEQRVHGRDELTAVTHHGDGRRGFVQDDLEAALVSRGPHALDGVGHHQVDQHRLARRGLLGLDARQVEQVVDDAADPEGLVVDTPG